MVRGERGTLEYADGPRTLREFVETTWAFGDTPFLIAGERRYSYGEFFAAASALAVRLNERYGLRPGDRAVVAMRNLPEWQIAFWAAQLAGLIAVPLNAWWTEDEFTYALDDCEPGVLLVDGERMNRVAGWARRAGARVVVFQREGQLSDGVSIERYEDFPAPDPLAAPPTWSPGPRTTPRSSTPPVPPAGPGGRWPPTSLRPGPHSTPVTGPPPPRWSEGASRGWGPPRSFR
ncbi:hypothetical protein Smic_32110 [Streptomyces microflavus]|uniref:AMP-dependent synthetase/ligase domain-containing protein n=1 Tax=Streptomyces microflavus TaxID=1919 RepID=A0A7J0CSI9_STRMI|nr:hypothetical protein Smic_32110 [Streptomyces microflavus]